jgi:hypothetical protein
VFGQISITAAASKCAAECLKLSKYCCFSINIFKL